MCRIRLINCRGEKLFNDLFLKSTTGPKEKPELSLELAKWIESNEISSNKLRNGSDSTEVNFSNKK